VRAAILTLAACFLFVHTLLPAPARAASTTEKVVDITFDVLILRPSGVLSTVVGAALFVPSALLTLPMGKAGIDQARSVFITPPYENTFTRKLGEW